MAISVLVVADGPFANNNPPSAGISFAPQDVTDNTFTIAEFVYLLRNNPRVPINVETAHRRTDPYATFQGFSFATSVNLALYDVLWLFGYEGWNYRDYGSPLGDNELQAIAQFMDNGGGVFATGDHAGMGSLMCGRIPRVRTMRKWFGRAQDLPGDYPAMALNFSGATVTSVNWPGVSGDPIPDVGRADTLQINPSDIPSLYQFDDQSDAIPQPLSSVGSPVHPVLIVDGSNRQLSGFPDHMHEGEVVAPLSLNAVLTFNGQSFTEYPSRLGNQPQPSVIATGNIVGGHATQVEGTSCEINNFTTDSTPTVANTIGILCAYDGRDAGVGRVLTDSSFHHYLDINLVGDPCGSSPDRQQGFGAALAAPQPGSVLADLQTFYVNAVKWLAPIRRSPITVPPAVATIIAGIIQDGGGLVGIGGSIIRIPPWDPWIDVLRVIAARNSIQEIRSTGTTEVMVALQRLVQNIVGETSTIADT